MFWRNNNQNLDFDNENLYYNPYKNNPYTYIGDDDNGKVIDKNVYDLSRRYCKYSIVCIIDTALTIFLATLVHVIITSLTGYTNDFIFGLIVLALCIGGYLVGLIMAIKAFARLRWWGSFIVVISYIFMSILPCVFMLIAYNIYGR